MTIKTIIDNLKIYKDIPIVLFNKEILFINTKAKQLLNYQPNKQKEILKKIKKAISNKTGILEIPHKNNIRTISIQCQQLEKKINIGVLTDLTKHVDSKSKLEKKLSLFEEIFDNLPIGILIHEDGKVKYINKYGLKVLEVKNKKQYQNFYILNFLANPKDKERAIKRIASKENILSSEIFEIKTFKNNKKIVDLYSYLFQTENGETDNTTRLIIFTDKTSEIEKQKLEVESQIKHYENQLLKKQYQITEKLLEKIESQQEQLLNAINVSNYLFWIMDENLNIILFNEGFYQYCLKYYNIQIKLGDNYEKIIHQYNESKEVFEQKISFLKSIVEKNQEFTYEITLFDKEEKKNRVYKMHMKPVVTSHKKMNHYYFYGHEITEKYEFLNQIEHQTIKLKEIIEHSPIYLWSMNDKEEITLFNKNYEILIEQLYGKKPVVGKKLHKGKYEQNKNIIDTLSYHYQKSFNGSQENFKLTFDVENGKKITLDVNLFPIVINNQIKEVSGIAIDITPEIEKQNQLQNLLKENEILIKEIHHRIKNNLQVISSMINIQIQEEENEHTKNILQDIKNRIFSMAIIHQTLYQNRNYTSINISNTIFMLVQNILYAFDKSDIQVESDIEEIILDVNTAVPVSLIINEGITNIVKYAFPDNFTKEKKIHILLQRNNHQLNLVIQDNGVGIPHQQLDNILSNVGFTIIRALSEQINAQLFITSQPNEGTEIKLIIPLV
ncbi:MAG: PAS domain S-box protein [Bacteroidia bacterium]|nr:PAS domain S-box protein [Bacteroidia bacterium]